MKTTIIPAQVTTVEDKIANNLNLTQLILLVCPILVGVVFYVFLPKPFKFTVYKIPLILVPFVVLPTLSLRIKGRVLVNWLILLVSYILRPHIYIFDKNDLYLRDITLKVTKKDKKVLKKSEATVSKNKNVELDASIDYQSISRNKDMNFKMDKKRILISKNI